MSSCLSNLGSQVTRYCPGHARGGNTHDATNTRFSVMAKRHELHHFPASPRSIAHQKPANSLQHRAWGKVGYVVPSLCCSSPPPPHDPLAAKQLQVKISAVPSSFSEPSNSPCSSPQSARQVKTCSVRASLFGHQHHPASPIAP